jgi:hypothetical protein
METILLYFLKVNGLLIFHYLVYYFFLKKETFFQSNRWFLIAGIFISFIIPLLSYSKIIWVDPQPVSGIYNTIKGTGITTISAPEEESIDWNTILCYCYVFISLGLFIKLTLEFISLASIIKSGQSNKIGKTHFVESPQIENPFSFFNYLVYNKKEFSKEELEYIFIHEKVHMQQKHSVDVLISKLLVLFFWINPIAWLYQKAMLQNLEFIADAESIKQTNQLYAYQKTLLKIVCSQNQLSITNQFYQSLIKKRIVMLNTNPSRKKDAWKYFVALPALVAFFLIFQVETIAQVKNSSVEANKDVSIVEMTIDKTSTDDEIKKNVDYFKDALGITVKVKNVKRNSQGEIYALSIEYNDSKGNQGKVSHKNDPSDPIEPVCLFTKVNNGKVEKIVFRDKTMEEKHITQSPYQVMLADSTIDSDEDLSDIENEDEDTDETTNDLVIVNGKTYSNEELKNVKIQAKGNVIVYSDKDANGKFRKDNVVVVNGKDVSYSYTMELPEPPVPPVFDIDFPTPPTPPNFPNVPDVPADFQDKIAMEKYEKAMKVYEKKMKAIEPKMKEFEKKMEAFEKEMEKKEPSMKKYEEAMKVYEEKMKVYEKKIEAYMQKMEESN